MTEKKLDSETLVKIVSRSGVADAERLRQVTEKAREKLGGRLPNDPRTLAKYFKKEGLITSWHAEKMLAGKYKGFFLGNYKLLGHIGTGGMSSVYLAEHVRMGDKRAIKVLPKNRVSDSTYLARFQLEAKAIASLKHKNIVRAFDIDNDGDVHYIVMEYVDGLDLQQIVKRDGGFDFSTAADVVAQAARGLEHAHQKGVIHRDIKPANLLVDQQGVVKLLDMGLALMDNDAESLTIVNQEHVLGTADYLAPEQAVNSHAVDHRADIYGLGCTMYYLLTAQPPFTDGTLAQRIAKHQSEMPPSIRQLRKDCPGELEGICVKMIQKDPKFRYQSAADVAETLEKFVAKVPKGEKLLVGLGEHSPYEDDDSNHSDFLEENRPLQGDTLSNKNGDTLAESRAKMLQGEGLSSSDSGRLVKLEQRPDFLDGSFLDLQLESGYRPDSNLGASRQKANKGGSAQHSGRSSVGVGNNSDVYQQRSDSKRNSDSLGGINRAVLGGLVLLLTLVAVAVGYFLARLTS